MPTDILYGKYLFMSRLLFLLITLVIVLSSPLEARGRIGEVKSRFVTMGASQFRSPLVNQHHKYSEQGIEGKINIPICGFTQGISLGLGYEHFRYDWSQNPYFSQKDFQYMKMSAGIFLRCWEGWLIAAQGTVWVDPEEWNFSDYAEYGGGIFARYQWNDCWAWWLGVLARGGLEDTSVLPVIGFNYCFCECWKLNLVMPMNISLEYNFYDCWSAFVAARVFFHRHRVGPEEPIPEGIFRYRNVGGEFGLEKCVGEVLSFKVFGGFSTGGSFKVMDKDGEFPIKRKFHSAPYGGASLEIKL